jgi:transposase
MQDVVIGVDVAQDKLDIAGSPGAEHLSIANQRRAIAVWLKKLPVGSVIAMESTGAHHQLLATLALGLGMRVFVLNPKRIWHYARSEGRHGKTDRIDAQVIRNYVRDHMARLHPWCPGTALQAEIETLQRRRQCLEKHFTAIRKSMSDVAGLRSEMKTFQDDMDALLQAIELRVQLLIGLDPQRARKDALLRTIPGVKAQGAAALGSIFERIPFVRSDAVVAYVGVDVRPSDSGHKRGRRRLSKQGPAHLRRQVWLSGFSAANSKIFKPLYQALCARGFASTEAFMILGRRILRIAWAVWRTDRPFDPSFKARPA